MPSWTDHLTRAEARAILELMADPKQPKTRYAARDSLGQPATRYVRPTAAEMARIRARAQEDV